MPLWEIVPAVIDGDWITDSDGNPITDNDGSFILFDAGWRLVPPEVDAPNV